MADSPNSTPAPKLSKRKARASANEYPFPITLRKSRTRPPELHVEGYACEVNGGCLEPIIFHGELVCIEPILPGAGEIACFCFKGAKSGVIKLNIKPIHGFPVSPLSEVMQLIESMQFNPIKQYACWADELLAIHRVRWVMREGQWLSANELMANFNWKELLRPGIPMPRHAPPPLKSAIEAVQS